MRKTSPPTWIACFYISATYEMNLLPFIFIAIFSSITIGTATGISTNVPSPQRFNQKLSRNFNRESTTSDLRFRSRNTRAISESLADYEELSDNRDFYVTNENYEDNEGVDDFYEDEIDREETNLAGTGLDEAIETVHVLKKGGHKFKDKSAEEKVVNADYKNKANAIAMHEGGTIEHPKGHPPESKAGETKSKDHSSKPKALHPSPSETKNPVSSSKDSDKDENSKSAKPGKIESLLSKLNTLIGDIETAEAKGDTDISNVAKGIIPSKENKTGDCTAFNHERITTGFKGYVTYMSTRVMSSLPYMMDGDETFLLHHLDDSNKKDNYKVSVEFSSKSCHCINAVNVKSIQLERRRHAILTKFTVEYNNGGWNYIHDDNGRIKIYSVNIGYDDMDHVVKLDLRIYARSFRIFPQDWKTLPWVRVNLIECPL